MFCKNCGKKLSDNAKFCTGCGEKVVLEEEKIEELLETAETTETTERTETPVEEVHKEEPKKSKKEKKEEKKGEVSQPQVINYYQTPGPQREIRDARDLPPQFRPISAWGYVGYNLLFALPIAGFIILLVFACGGHSNKNVQNYALSYFCAIILVVLIAVIFALTGVGLFAALKSAISSSI